MGGGGGEWRGVVGVGREGRGGGGEEELCWSFIHCWKQNKRGIFKSVQMSDRVEGEGGGEELCWSFIHCWKQNKRGIFKSVQMNEREAPHGLSVLCMIHFTT